MARYSFSENDPPPPEHPDRPEPPEGQHPDPPQDQPLQKPNLGEGESFDNVLDTETGSSPASSPTVGNLPPGPIAAAQVSCINCGYDLTGVPLGANCPECGTPVNKSFQSMRQPTSGMATASMVLGICSIPGCFCWGIPSLVCGILAVVFYAQVRSDVKNGRVAPGSMGIATAGLITGIVGLALAFLGLLWFVFSFVSAII